MSLNNINYNLNQLSISEFLIDESSKKQHTVNSNFMQFFHAWFKILLKNTNFW